jgi:hypothetical protein
MIKMASQTVGLFDNWLIILKVGVKKYCQIISNYGNFRRNLGDES